MKINPIARVLDKVRVVGFERLSDRDLEVYYTYCHLCLGEYDSSGNCPDPHCSR